MRVVASPLSRRAMLLAGGSALAAGGLAFLYPVRNREFNSIDITGADYARDGPGEAAVRK